MRTTIHLNDKQTFKFEFSNLSNDRYTVSLKIYEGLSEVHEMLYFMNKEQLYMLGDILTDYGRYMTIEE